MESSDFTHREVNDYATRLLSNQPYRGVGYSNLQAYGENIREDVDPDCLLKPTILSTYWPAGLPGMENNKFGTLQIGGQKARYEDVTTIRKRLLSLQLSKRALRRWADFKSTYPGNTIDSSHDPDDFMVPLACEIGRVPLSAVVFSEVVRHKSIRPGKFIAAVYFPNIYNDPRRALKVLQSAQQNTIDEEAFLDS